MKKEFIEQHRAEIDAVIEIVRELDQPDCVHLNGPAPQVVYRDQRSPVLRVMRPAAFPT